MDRKIRQGQIINTFSIGQIVPFPNNENLMLCGMEQWDRVLENRKSQGVNIEESEFKITDAKRLQRLLNVKYFKKPFPFKSNRESSIVNREIHLPAVRFPGWHYCTNSNCRRMQFLGITFQDDELSCTMCNPSLKPFQKRLIPVRFVAVCNHGHIQDVPFDEWVHNGNRTGHQLQWNSGFGSGDLGSISIRCLDSECRASRSLAGLMNIRVNESDNQIFDSALARLGLEDRNALFSNENPNNNNPNGYYCQGHRPWLGSIGVNAPDTCTSTTGRSHLRVLIAGGSNVHYAKNKSSIYIPDIGLKINTYVEGLLTDERRNNLESILIMDIDKKIQDKLIIQQIQNAIAGLNPSFRIEEILTEVLNQLKNVETDTQETTREVDIRFEEYNYFLSGNDNADGDLVFDTKEVTDYEGSSFLEEHFASIILVKKLKETRAFYGFSRISPHDGKTIEESKSMLVSDDTSINWLPAIQVFGEGIFIKFKDEKIDDWLLQNSSLTERMENAYHQSQSRRNSGYGSTIERKDVNPVFILLHTFAHLLIKRLCFNCGYGSSALREKIYFSSSEETRMNGILIYTSSGDSEGSLGGLVRQGNEKNLYPVIQEALIDAEWCSADPVCSDIGREGQGPDNVNGAACHNCTILPETSCEEFNGLLDRNVVVGSLENKDIGYFRLEF